MRPALLFASLAFVLTGCGTMPVVPGAPASAAGQTPALVPLSSVLAASKAGPAIDTAPVPSARLAALRARADRLRGPVIPGPTRTRMTRAMLP